MMSKQEQTRSYESEPDSIFGDSEAAVSPAIFASNGPPPAPADPLVNAGARAASRGLGVADLAGIALDPSNPQFTHPYGLCYLQSALGLGFRNQTLLGAPGSCTAPVSIHQWRMAGGVAYLHMLFMSQLSAMVTQPADATLTMWTEDPSELERNPMMAWLLRHFGPDAKGPTVVDAATGERLAPTITLQRLDINALAEGTPLQGTPHLEQKDEKGWSNGDLIRLLVMRKHGGIYVDGDMLFMRSLEPFACLAADTGFVGGWMCWGPGIPDAETTEVDNGPPGYYMNAAFSGFSADHAAVTAILSEIVVNPLPRSPGVDWNCLLGMAAHRNMKRAHAETRSAPRPFEILPWCYSEFGMCPLPAEFPEVTRDVDDATWARFAHRLLGHIAHWHNRYDKPIGPRSPLARLHAAIYKGLVQRYGEAIAQDLPTEAQGHFRAAMGR